MSRNELFCLVKVSIKEDALKTVERVARLKRHPIISLISANASTDEKHTK